MRQALQSALHGGCQKGQVGRNMAWGWAEQAESDEREREEEMQEPESGWASRAGYNTEEDDAPARQGRVSSTSQQEPAVLSRPQAHY